MYIYIYIYIPTITIRYDDEILWATRCEKTI